jgi:hypothetical protein
LCISRADHDTSRTFLRSRKGIDRCGRFEYVRAREAPGHLGAGQSWVPYVTPLCNEAQAPTPEMAVTPPSIRKSAPTTYAESSDAR